METKEFVLRVLSLVAITAMICAYLLSASSEETHKKDREAIISACNDKLASCASLGGFPGKIAAINSSGFALPYQKPPLSPDSRN